MLLSGFFGGVFQGDDKAGSWVSVPRGGPAFAEILRKKEELSRCARGVGLLRACLKMGRGPAAGEFWVGQGGERRGRPLAVCSARTNAVQAGKTRRPEGLVGKGPLAALLVGHRPLRVCFLLAPCQSNFSLPNRTPSHFQTGSLTPQLSSVRPAAAAGSFLGGWG